jgi:predicted dinucleotide-binding enzyme
MIVTIVGAGRLAEGIAVRALAGGCTLRLADAEPGKAEALAGLLGGRVAAVTDVAGLAGVLAGSDVVVLALPYPEGRRVAAQQGAAMAGLTLVDTCNPVDFSTFDALLTSPGMSAAEEIAREVATVSPAAHVVKAFSTTLAATLLTGQVAGLPLDVFLAGDDPAAKAKVAALVRAGGMRPVDAGPLRRSRELEALQLLHMTLQGPLGLDWASAVKLLPLHLTGGSHHPRLRSARRGRPGRRLLPLRPPGGALWLHGRPGGGLGTGAQDRAVGARGSQRRPPGPRGRRRG